VLLDASLLLLISTCELHNHHLPTPSALYSLCNIKKRVLTMMILKLLLALLMLLSINLRSSESICYDLYYPRELEALQTILGAWNESTPDMTTNLAGWSSSQPYPCYTNQSWRGVICSYYVDSITDPCNFTINIVVIHLTAASIVGTLPSAIENLTQLVEL
jgi:hypothetical protein